MDEDLADDTALLVLDALDLILHHQPARPYDAPDSCAVAAQPPAPKTITATAAPASNESRRIARVAGVLPASAGRDPATSDRMSGDAANSGAGARSGSRPRRETSM